MKLFPYASILTLALLLSACGTGLLKGPTPQPIGKLDGVEAHSFTCHYAWGFGYEECVEKLRNDFCGPSVKVVSRRDRQVTNRVLACNKWVWQTITLGELTLTGCRYKEE